MQRVQGDFDPYQVREVKPADYNSVHTQDRYEGIVFCGPRKYKKECEVFEIVVLSIKSDAAFW